MRGRDRVTWPLFECLTSGTQKLLRKYQEKNFPKIKLSEPPPSDASQSKWNIVLPESRKEIARIMKETPRHQKRVV